MTTVSYARSVSEDHKARLKRFAADTCELRCGLEELVEDIKASGPIEKEDEEEFSATADELEALTAEVEFVEGELNRLVKELVGDDTNG